MLAKELANNEHVLVISNVDEDLEMPNCLQSCDRLRAVYLFHTSGVRWKRPGDIDTTPLVSSSNTHVSVAVRVASRVFIATWTVVNSRCYTGNLT